ncbi:hypothetical protein L0F63_006507 [Massospora cicadina]|nr:hypothetical protein L0F63_006507 [Massospora cicadina]
MPRVAEGLLTIDLDSLAFSIYNDASEEGLPRDADSAKLEYGGRTVKPGCSGVKPQAKFQEDLLIRYCRGGTDIACREFSTVIMDYDNSPSSWRCSSHKVDHPESSSEVQFNSAGFQAANLLDGDLDSSSCSHSDASGESDPAYNRCTAHIKFEYGVYVSDAMMRLLKHYYKIGRQLNIRHNNQEKLKRPHDAKYTVPPIPYNLGLLKRTSPTCGKLFMMLLRCELTINNFTVLSRDERYSVVKDPLIL